ncbi:hypothetical protein [Clostridium sporogenes]|uniref:Uncharacterized protein n=1 Tax=Clostridium sporogenes TaxID=1509 RepID=A0AAE6I7V7_CLOSG|nr:hypothetical protein [Clostridium sporogenes]QDY32653.1 hypothetical protein CGS26_09910 [Clostridium sporogenes]
MKYLFYEKETDTKAKFTLTYNVIPPEHMLNDGNYIVSDDILPKPELKENEYVVHYINPQTKEQSYEIYTKEKTQEEQDLRERLSTLEKSNAEMMNLIATMATPTE